MKDDDETQLFILVDDDPINNSITRLTISYSMSNAEIIIFSDPRAGFKFLAGTFVQHPATSVVLLLNLNMPIMNGWEFLAKFRTLEARTQQRVRVYILTSSIDPLDRRKSAGIECVKGFLTKPLSREMVLNL